MVHATFTVTVNSAKNLPKADLFGKIDSYVEVSFGGERMQTATKKSEYDPVYGESHEFTLSIDDHDDVPELKLSLYDWDRIKTNEFIGCVVLTGREMHNILERGPGAVVGDSHSLHNQDKKVVGNDGKTLSKLSFSIEVGSYGKGRKPASGIGVIARAASGGTAKPNPHLVDIAEVSSREATPSPMPQGDAEGDGRDADADRPSSRVSASSKGSSVAVPSPTGRLSKSGSGTGGEGADRADEGAGEVGAAVGDWDVVGPMTGGGDFNRELLRVTVIEAHNLPEMVEHEFEHSMMLTYAMVSYGETSTQVATPPRPGLNPFWGESGGVTLNVGGSVSSSREETIRVTVRSVVGEGDEPSGDDELVGDARVELRKVLSSCWGGGGRLSVAFSLAGPGISDGSEAKILIAFEYPAGEGQGGSWLPSSPSKEVLEEGGGKFYEGIGRNVLWKRHVEGRDAAVPEPLDMPELPFENRGPVTPEDVLDGQGVKADDLVHIKDFYFGLQEPWGGLGGGDGAVIDAMINVAGMSGEAAERFGSVADRWRKQKTGKLDWGGSYEEFLLVLSMEASIAKGLVEGLVLAQKREIQALRKELENARVGMELLKEFGVLPRDDEEGGVANAEMMGVELNWGEVWRRARETMEELAGKQVLKESKETQCDIDPFENDIFVHYMPTQSRLAGMAGQTDAGSAKEKRPDLKDTSSRILMATCVDEDGRAGRGMSKDELARRKQELERIAAGKDAVSQTVHEWSFEGAQLLDAALKPGMLYASSMTHPGTLAARRYVRGGGGVGLRGGGEGGGGFMDNMRGF